MSHTLILMRHGQAAAPAGTPDHERPLTDDGAAQATAVGAWMADRLPPVRAVLCSTARRTRRTLDAVAVGAGWAPDARRPGDAAPERMTPAPECTYTRAIYEAAAEDVLGAIAPIDADAATLLVVGHFPGLPHTALALDPAGPHSGEVRRGLPAAGCIVLRTDTLWDAFPDALRGAATPFAAIRQVRMP